MRLFGFGKKDNKNTANKLIGNIFKYSREYVDHEGQYPDSFNLYSNDNFYIALSRLELKKCFLYIDDKSEELCNFKISDFYNEKDENKTFSKNLRDIIWIFNRSITLYKHINKDKLKTIFDNAYEKCVIYLSKAEEIFKDKEMIEKYLLKDKNKYTKLGDNACDKGDIYSCIYTMGKLNAHIIESLLLLTNIFKNNNVDDAEYIIKIINDDFNNLDKAIENIKRNSYDKLSLDLIKSNIKAARIHNDTISEAFTNETLEKQKDSLNDFCRKVDVIQELCIIIQGEINRIGMDFFGENI